MRRSSAAVVLVALLGACTGPSVVASGGVLAESKPFPHLAGATVQGAQFDTASLRGKPFVLNVWATWCDPCRREQPALMRLHRRYGETVGFLGINYRNDDAAAREWVRQYGVTYPSLSDPAGRTARDLGYPYLPDTYVVDATGTIRFVVFGETKEQQLAALIDQVLASAASVAG
jgi:thiol-disulfide isomerase/thioredoxin